MADPLLESVMVTVGKGWAPAVEGRAAGRQAGTLMASLMRRRRSSQAVGDGGAVGQWAVAHHGFTVCSGAGWLHGMHGAGQRRRRLCDV
jgi:hypothetical protein